MFLETAPGALAFQTTPPPTDAEVARVVATVRARIQWVLARRGFGPDAEGTVDPLVEESPVLGRVALGRRAGARVWRLGSEPDAPWITSSGPRQAHLEGFDLQASTTPASPRARAISSGRPSRPSRPPPSAVMRGDTISPV